MSNKGFIETTRINIILVNIILLTYKYEITKYLFSLRKSGFNLLTARRK